jgi:glycosyltransferase involved in cell wall biosynthesis
MKPRILAFVKLFWPEGGGAELATYLIFKDILSKYFDVTIVSGTRNPEPDILKHARYIHWNVLEARYKPIEWIKTFTCVGWIKNLVEKADIVYIPSHTLIPLTIAVKTINPKAKVVLHLHNYQLLTYTSIILAGKEPDAATDIIVELGEHKSLLRAMLAGFGHYINYINRLAAALADKIICVSYRQRKIILRYIPEVNDRSEVVYNPPPSLPSLNKRIGDKPIVIYAGGGSYVKGFEIFLKAILKALIRDLDIKVYITYGRDVPPKEKILLKRIAQNLGNKLILLGRLSYDGYLKLHEVAWTLLFPSIYEEPLPYAVVESLLIGTIPIAARVGGIPEIIEGTVAERFLFEAGNVDSFIDKISELISCSKDEIVNLGIKLRRHAFELFDVKAIENKLISLFESLL